jgi:hypothetical protein
MISPPRDQIQNSAFLVFAVRHAAGMDVRTAATRTISMQTTFKRDWAVGAKVSGGFKIPKIKVGVDIP